MDVGEENRDRETQHGNSDLYQGWGEEERYEKRETDQDCVNMLTYKLTIVLDGLVKGKADLDGREKLLDVRMDEKPQEKNHTVGACILSINVGLVRGKTGLRMVGMSELRGKKVKADMKVA